MRYALIGLLSFLLVSASHAQVPVSLWTNYDTSSKINSKNFQVLTKAEVEMKKQIPGFADNRARLTLTDGTNRISPAELQQPNYPALCQCLLNKDTIYINMAIGFMSGLGIKTTISKNLFASSFFQGADNTDVFKFKKTDTTYIDRISIPAEQQKLTLFKAPAFKTGEIITGSFAGQFAQFYELYLNREPPLERNYKAKFFFKCRLR